MTRPITLKSVIQRVTVRTLTAEWQHMSGWHAPTLRVLKEMGLCEISADSLVRLTQNGIFVRKALPPEPVPESHTPEWRRKNWKLDHLPEPYVPTEIEKLRNGW